MSNNHHTKASNQPLTDARPARQDSPELSALLNQWADHARSTEPPQKLLPRARRRRARRIWLHRSAAAMVLLTVGGGLWSTQTGVYSINDPSTGPIASTHQTEPSPTRKDTAPSASLKTPAETLAQQDNTANNLTTPAIVESDRAILEPVNTHVPGVTIVWYFPIQNTPTPSPTGQSTPNPDHKLAGSTPCNTQPIQPI